MKTHHIAACLLLALTAAAGCATDARNWLPEWNERKLDEPPPFHVDERDVGR
ncbi:MAG: hypothetical protein AAF532_12655 [Planctomycetota bacterium]